MHKRTIPENGQLQSPEMACYHAVHQAKGGLQTIASLMGMLPGTLQKKLSPTVDTHKLSLAEAMHILRFTESTAVLDSIGAEAGVVWFKPDDVPEFCGDLDLLSSHSELFSAASKFIGGVTNALADGVINKNEQALVKRLKLDLQKAIKQVDAVSAQFEEQ
ncbi:phage regulatory CII family protein [Gammaproteobacteria bacterium AS21]